MIIETFRKSAVDVIDYDFDFSAWLSKRGNDTIDTFTVTATTGISVVQSSKNLNVIKAFIGGGIDGKNYEVSCTIHTVGGRTKQATIRIIIG